MESRFKNQSEKLNKKITAMIMAFMVTIVCLGTGISAEANTKAALEAPQITNCYIDGEYVCFEWTEVSGVKSYHVYYSYTNTRGELFTSKNKFYVPIKGRGMDYSIEVYAVNDKTESNKGTATIYVPEIDYSDIDYIDASCLSLSQLEEWANHNGMEWEVSEKKGYTILSMEEKDKNNSGFLNGLKAVAKGVFDNVMKSTEKKLENIDSDEITSEVEDVIGKGLEKDSMSEAIKEKASEEWEQTKVEAAASAIVGGVKGAMGYLTKNDKNIHYEYFYESDMVQYAAQIEVISFLKANNDEHIEYIKNNLEKISEDGEDLYLTVSADETRHIGIMLKVNDANDRWINYIVPLF